MEETCQPKYANVETITPFTKTLEMTVGEKVTVKDK